MNRSRHFNKVFRKFGLLVSDIHIGLEDGSLEIPSVTIDRTSYPGVEAHLFTVAAIANWRAQFNPEYNILLSFPEITRCSQERTTPNHILIATWQRLTDALTVIADRVKSYRRMIDRGMYPSIVWGHHASEWHRELWESCLHEYVPPSEFIDYVDRSIRNHIIELNELGFATIESCSGLKWEHPDREPYRPYVMFDERSYPGSTPHFFTLGDMAGWESVYAPHGFDAYIRVYDGDHIESAWERLVRVARILGPLLKDYRHFSRQMYHSKKHLESPEEQERERMPCVLVDDSQRKIHDLSGIQ